MHTNELQYPLNPILCRVTRAGQVESVHRGAWCLVDSSGRVLDGAGDVGHEYFVRSSIKAIQAVPLLESGAAERFGMSAAELAISLASHSGEACHTELVSGALGRMGIAAENLLCGVHPPNDPETRRALLLAGERANALHNNCSGKHMGFLALAKHLDVALADYLKPDSEVQEMVRAVLCQMTDLNADQLGLGMDGCSAPTYRLSLEKLAMAFARVANPDGLESKRGACFRRMTSAAAEYPDLIAGRHKRIDTDLLRASGGRIFAKIGAEAVHAIGVVGSDCGLALKMDDGGLRGLHCVIMGLLERLGLLPGAGDVKELKRWSEPVMRNHAGLGVGRIELVISS
jgi:L-asparaginase II